MPGAGAGAQWAFVLGGHHPLAGPTHLEGECLSTRPPPRQSSTSSSSLCTQSCSPTAQRWGSCKTALLPDFTGPLPGTDH